MSPTSKEDLSQTQSSKTGVTKDFINEFALLTPLIEYYEDKKN